MYQGRRLTCRSFTKLADGRGLGWKIEFTSLSTAPSAAIPDSDELKANNNNSNDALPPLPPTSTALQATKQVQDRKPVQAPKKKVPWKLPELPKSRYIDELYPVFLYRSFPVAETIPALPKPVDHSEKTVRRRRPRLRQTINGAVDEFGAWQWPPVSADVAERDLFGALPWGGEESTQPEAAGDLPVPETASISSVYV